MTEQAKHERLLRSLAKLPHNRCCFVCNALGSQYVVPAFGIFVCTDCSGKSMACGQRVKSISMGKFTPEEVKTLEEGGNEAASKKYLAKWNGQGDAAKPVDKNPRKVESWIRAVLVEKRYYSEVPNDGEQQHQPAVTTNSGQATDHSKIPVKPLTDILGSAGGSVKLQVGSERVSNAGAAETRSSAAADGHGAPAPTPAASAFDPFGEPVAAESKPSAAAATANNASASSVFDPFGDSGFPAATASAAPANNSHTPAPAAAAQPANAFDPFSGAGAASPFPSSATSAPPPNASSGFGNQAATGFSAFPSAPVPASAPAQPPAQASFAASFSAFPPPPPPPHHTTNSAPQPPVQTAAAGGVGPAGASFSSEATDWGAFEAASSAPGPIPSQTGQPIHLGQVHHNAAPGPQAQPAGGFDPFGGDSAFPASSAGSIVPQPRTASNTSVGGPPAAGTTGSFTAVGPAGDAHSMQTGAASNATPAAHPAPSVHNGFNSVDRSSNPAAAGVTGGDRSSRNAREELPPDLFSEGPVVTGYGGGMMAPGYGMGGFGASGQLAAPGMVPAYANPQHGLPPQYTGGLGAQQMHGQPGSGFSAVSGAHQAPSHGFGGPVNGYHSGPGYGGPASNPSVTHPPQPQGFNTGFGPAGFTTTGGSTGPAGAQQPGGFGGNSFTSSTGPASWQPHSNMPTADPQQGMFGGGNPGGFGNTSASFTQGHGSAGFAAQPTQQAMGGFGQPAMPGGYNMGGFGAPSQSDSSFGAFAGAGPMHNGAASATSALPAGDGAFANLVPDLHKSLPSTSGNPFA